MLRRLPEAFERKTWALTRPRGSGSWVNHKALIISSWPKTHHGQWISRLIFLWRIDENWCPLTGLPNDLLRDSVLKRCMHFIYLIFSSHNHITFLSTMVCMSLLGRHSTIQSPVQRQRQWQWVLVWGEVNRNEENTSKCRSSWLIDLPVQWDPNGKRQVDKYLIPPIHGPRERTNKT